MPASRMKLALDSAAPATPITSERLLTRPSLTPKMVARSVPDWPLRCQDSRRAVSRGCSTAVPGAGLAPTAAFWSAVISFQISACSRSSAAMAATSGESWAL